MVRKRRELPVPQVMQYTSQVRMEGAEGGRGRVTE
jgi:hypothetical protein